MAVIVNIADEQAMDECRNCQDVFVQAQDEILYPRVLGPYCFNIVFTAKFGYNGNPNQMQEYSRVCEA